MVEETTVLIVIMIVGLFVYLALSPGQNVLTDLYDALANKQPIFSIYKTSAEASVSGSYNYLVKASADIKIVPGLKEDTEILPVISFKGADYKDTAGVFTIRSGDTTAAYSNVLNPARMHSDVPPLQWIGDSFVADNVVEGQEFAAGFSNDAQLYKITMPVITSSCGTGFTVLCSDGLSMQTKSQIGLKKCRYDTDPDCIADFRICSGEVLIKQAGEIDCIQRKANGVNIKATDNRKPWTIKDTLTILFFKRTQCVEREDALDKMRQCGSLRDGKYELDFLGSVNVPLDVR